MKINPNIKSKKEVEEGNKLTLELLSKILAILITGGTVYYFFIRLLFL